MAPETANLAETTRMVEVADALRARGHTVLVAGYSLRYSRHVEDRGLPWRALEPEFTDAQAELMLAADQGRSLRHPFTPGLVERRVSRELDLYEEFAPDAVLTGSNLTALASARIARLPLVYVKPFALSGPHLESTRSGRLVRRVPYLPRGFRRVLSRAGIRGTSMMDLLEADLNLVTSAPWELDGFDLPADYVPVGPVFAHLPGEVPEIVRELADRPTPLVYAALGSSGSRALALRMIAELGRLPVLVVAPLTGLLRPTDLDGVPPNVHLTDLLPAHRLGGLVDAAVLHGGEGTVQTAGATGVPFVGIPLQAEQRFNVDQRVRWGTAVRVDPRRVGGPSFARALRTVLDDDGVHRAAREVAERYRGLDGGTRAAREIESFVSPGNG